MIELIINEEPHLKRIRKECKVVRLFCVQKVDIIANIYMYITYITISELRRVLVIMKEC